MTCKLCKKSPVTTLPNNDIQVCKNCFFKYFEKKVFRTIGQYNLIDKKDIIGVAASGGKDSITILYILNKFLEKRRMKDRLVAITINNGIKGEEKTLAFLKKFCKENKIKLYIYSFKKEFGKTMDQYVKNSKEEHPCSICGVLRRSLLNKKAKKLKITKIVTGHNLDDEAQTILMNQFRRNIKASARLGPITGIINDKRFVRRIKPLYFLLEKEAELYAKLKGFIVKYEPCHYKKVSYRNVLKKVLNDFEDKYPGTKHSIIQSFLEILPLLRKEFVTRGLIKSCKLCKEPCSKDICQACKILEKFNLKH